MMKTPRITLYGLYAWGYSQESRDIRFLTNVIQCQCGKKYAKMKGLHRLVSNGHEVRSGNTVFDVRIDGEMMAIERLEDVTVGGRLLARA